MELVLLEYRFSVVVAYFRVFYFKCYWLVLKEWGLVGRNRNDGLRIVYVVFRISKGFNNNKEVDLVVR